MTTNVYQIKADPLRDAENAAIIREVAKRIAAPRVYTTAVCLSRLAHPRLVNGVMCAWIVRETQLRKHPRSRMIVFHYFPTQLAACFAWPRLRVG
jgi:hypothetical protein